MVPPRQPVGAANLTATPVFVVDSLDQDLVPYVIRQQFKGPDVLAKYVKDPIGPTETQVSRPSLHDIAYHNKCWVRRCNSLD